MASIFYSDNPGKSSSRIIFLGCIYVLLGLIAVGFAGLATVASILTLGAVLLVAGIAEIVYGVQGRKRGQLWPHLAFGCLALICGVLIFMNPVANALGFTLIAGFLLIAGGLAKIIGSAVERSTGWGWYLTNGIISLLLGGLILGEFPVSAFWAIGVFVGADLVVAGAMLVGLGVWAKRTKQELVGEFYSTLNPTPAPSPRVEPSPQQQEAPPPH